MANKMKPVTCWGVVSPAATTAVHLCFHINSKAWAGDGAVGEIPSSSACWAKLNYAAAIHRSTIAAGEGMIVLYQMIALPDQVVDTAGLVLLSWVTQFALVLRVVQ